MWMFTTSLKAYCSMFRWMAVSNHHYIIFKIEGSNQAGIQPLLLRRKTANSSKWEMLAFKRNLKNLQRMRHEMLKWLKKTIRGAFVMSSWNISLDILWRHASWNMVAMRPGENGKDHSWRMLHYIYLFVCSDLIDLQM